MANLADRLPQNVPGKFYVDSSCTDCEACIDTAPENFARDEAEGVSYVAKQPSTPEEEAKCIEAMEGCPTESIGNDGA
ncbi:MAG: ferredoxin [Candidatus Sumerlaeia bacterium]